MSLSELPLLQLQKNNDSISDLSSLECFLTKDFFNYCILTVIMFRAQKSDNIKNINDGMLHYWMFKQYQLENGECCFVLFFSSKETLSY